MLAVISALTRGEPLPECEQAPEPVNVIYQTAEDGLADTIKPRLEAAGADCARVLVIDESKRELNLSDERLEQALRKTGAQLMVLDPIQAYLGDGVDMHRANEVRPILKRTAAMAERTGCAVILIGHMNKAQGLKSGYRGLGSIDFRAAARSVLVVGRLKDDPAVRIVAQDKNSLAPEGKSIAFQLDGERGFKWKGTCDLSVDDVLSGSGKLQTKTLQMEEELERMLREAATAEAVLNRAKELGVSERTLMTAKRTRESFQRNAAANGTGCCRSKDVRMQRSKNFAPLHPSFYAVLCLRRTGLAPMNGKSSLQGGQAEAPVRLCRTWRRRPTGDIAGGSPYPLYGGISETEKGKTHHAPSYAGAIRKNPVQSRNSTYVHRSLCPCDRFEASCRSD